MINNGWHCVFLLVLVIGASSVIVASDQHRDKNERIERKQKKASLCNTKEASIKGAGKYKESAAMRPQHVQQASLCIVL